MNNTVILLMANDGIYFNGSFSVPYFKTNLPDKKHFHFYNEVFWKVEYIFKNGLLKVNVLNYSLKKSDLGNFYSRSPKNSNPIKEIYFEKLDWKKFEDRLIEYTKSEIVKVTNYESADYNFNLDNYRLNRGNFGMRSTFPFPGEREYSEEFWVPISEVRFMDGFVKFEKSFKWIVEPLEIQIENKHIREEFDLIKYAFSKRFGTKNRIRVKAQFKDIPGEKFEYEA